MQRTERGIVDVPRVPTEVRDITLAQAESQPIRAVASLALRESVLGLHDVGQISWFNLLACLTVALACSPTW